MPSKALLVYVRWDCMMIYDLDVIRNADYILDMGPGGGEEGGEIVACGRHEDIRKEPKSVTGRYL